MIDRLFGAWSKVERAKKHVADFDRAKVNFLASDPYRIITKFNQESGNTDCFIDRSEPVPTDFSLIVGDAVHNLRSALDHLAVALVREKSGTKAVTTRTAFPVCDSLKKYKAESPGKTEGMREEAKHAIDRVAPYPGGNDLLFGIHELDRIDKHHVLVTTACVAAKLGMEIGPKELNRIAPGFIRFEDKSIPSRMYWFDLRPDLFGIVGENKNVSIVSIVGDFVVNQNIKFAFDIAFGEPEIIQGKSVVETLSAAIQVVENLLTDFEPFFV